MSRQAKDSPISGVFRDIGKDSDRAMRWIKGILKTTRSDLSEYFYWIFLITFIVISVLGGALYFYFSNILKEQAITENSNTLIQLKNAHGAVLEEMDKSLSSIVTDSLISSFYDYYNENDIVMMMIAQSKLSQVVNLNESLDSICVLYNNSGLVLSSDKGIVQPGRYYDQEFLSQISGTVSNQILSRVKLSASTGSSATVLTFVNTLPIYVTSGRAKALVVFNLKGESLQKTLDSITTFNNSNILVTDFEGSVITQKAYVSEEDLNAVFAGMGSPEEEVSDWFITSFSGEKQLISYVNSSKYHLRYLSVTPFSAITESIRFLGIITILFCVLMIILSLLGSLFLSRKLYSPIKSALALFSSPASGKSGEARNGREISGTALLQSNINQMIQKNKSLEALFQEYDSFRKNQFLLSLMENSANDEKITERLTYYGVDIEIEGNFTVFLVAMDRYRDMERVYSEKQITMLSLYTQETLADRILSEHKGFFVEKGPNEILLAISFPEIMPEEELYRLSRHIGGVLHETVSRNMKFTFTVGVGLPVKGIENLSKSYEEAVMAVSRRLLLGYNNIIFYENLGADTGNMKGYPFSLERKLLESIRSGDRSQVIRLMNEFSEQMQGVSALDIEYVRYYFLQLLASSVKCFYEVDRGFSMDLMHKELYGAILGEPTIHQITSRFKDLYFEFLDYMEVQRSERNGDMSKAVASYVEDNLNTDLSLEMLGEKFAVSGYQLRKIFKEEFGIGPKEYIDGLRMKKAAELLSTTTLKVSDIAERVGYVSLQSFIRAFKASIGSTPGEYRQKCSMEVYSTEVKE